MEVARTMTQEQVVDIAAGVILEYPQVMSLPEAIEASERIMQIITTHPAYSYDDDHISIVMDGANGRLDVKLLAEREEMYAYFGGAVQQIMPQ
jgi:hypothetical protein